MDVLARTRTQEIRQDPEFGPWLAQASILIVDDEPGMRNFLSRAVGPRCKKLEEAGSAEEASAKLDSQYFDVVILDNILPGKSGMRWLAEQRSIGFFSHAILITAYADLETAIQALQMGAVDFVLKPFQSNQILNAIARCMERIKLQRENVVLRHELRSRTENALLRDRLVGRSTAISRVRETIARVAPLPTSVLITGQSGVGKEVAARSLHALSDRSEKPFVPVNCAAIPRDMIESELFGHVKGAFTGASAAREGLKELGIHGMLSPFKMSCVKHDGAERWRMMQWNGQKFDIVSDWIGPNDPQMIRKMIEDSADKFAKENNITPRTCS